MSRIVTSSLVADEETRVVLREFGDCNSNDYINANYIRVLL